MANPLDGASNIASSAKDLKSRKIGSPQKVGASNVIKLILLTIIICVCAYYFGL